jgi:hypothetical protein
MEPLSACSRCHHGAAASMEPLPASQRHETAASISGMEPLPASEACCRCRPRPPVPGRSERGCASFFGCECLKSRGRGPAMVNTGCARPSRSAVKQALRAGAVGGGGLLSARPNRGTQTARRARPAVGLPASESKALQRTRKVPQCGAQYGIWTRGRVQPAPMGAGGPRRPRPPRNTGETVCRWRWACRGETTQRRAWLGPSDSCAHPHAELLGCAAAPCCSASAGSPARLRWRWAVQPSSETCGCAHEFGGPSHARL